MRWPRSIVHAGLSLWVCKLPQLDDGLFLSLPGNETCLALEFLAMARMDGVHASDVREIWFLPLFSFADDNLAINMDVRLCSNTDSMYKHWAVRSLW